MPMLSTASSARPQPGSWAQIGSWHRLERDGAVATAVPFDALPGDLRVDTPDGAVAIADLSIGDPLTLYGAARPAIRELRGVSEYLWIGGDHPDKGVRLDVYASASVGGDLALPMNWRPKEPIQPAFRLGVTPTRLFRIELDLPGMPDATIRLNDMPCRPATLDEQRTRSWRILIDGVSAPIHAQRNGHVLIRLPAGASKIEISGEASVDHMDAAVFTLWDTMETRILEAHDLHRSPDRLVLNLDRHSGHLGMLSITFP